MIQTRVDLILDLLDLVKLNLTMIFRTSGNMITVELYNKEEIKLKMNHMNNLCSMSTTMNL